MDFQHDHVTNEYKTRNILRLKDRVQVIREYDSYPTRRSYQSLATMFDCSAKQIKNILLSRESVLKAYQEWGDTTSCNDSRDEDAQKRQEKIDFLGKVLHEYLQRVVYYNYSVDEEKVRQKAFQIKECIAIENFQLNKGWFEHFKLAYGIVGCDMKSLQNNIHVTEEKKPHLSAIKLIQHVSREEHRSQLNINGIKKRLWRPSCVEKLQLKNKSTVEPKIVYEPLEDDDYCTVEQDSNGKRAYKPDVSQSKRNKILPKLRTTSQTTTFHDQVIRELNKPKPKPAAIEMYSQQPVANMEKLKRADSPIPDIDSPERALKYVKALEEYAMLQDSFRAIGLLTQLEQIFQNKLKET